MTIYGINKGLSRGYKNLDNILIVCMYIMYEYMKMNQQTLEAEIIIAVLYCRIINEKIIGYKQM